MTFYTKNFPFYLINLKDIGSLISYTKINPKVKTLFHMWKFKIMLTFLTNMPIIPDQDPSDFFVPYRLSSAWTVAHLNEMRYIC